ncbi:hypothetical protein P691DRAFT_768318 [Macrolepiota fuliginosa MF-IS2]|uniref:Uncharacterized protein n=1 Tax=Macrolepiota fuliginosa MF-IS2 TaxID=1400762 RepID=A0A9P6BV06_9AGAR|nr:hypothetical protein P691DRAFT_768318 [Macrolepiota fuliginosa MF-IS2]
MSHTIIIPAITQSENDTEANSTPFPQAYRHAKLFLKSILKEKLQLMKQQPNMTLHLAIYNYSSQKVVAEKFQEQLLAYACGKYPFLEGTSFNNKGGPLEWWRALEWHPNADILAMLAIHVFSIQIKICMDKPAISSLSKGVNYHKSCSDQSMAQDSHTIAPVLEHHMSHFTTSQLGERVHFLVYIASHADPEPAAEFDIDYVNLEGGWNKLLEVLAGSDIPPMPT